MTRLVASDLALRSLLALSQRPDGLRIAEVANVLEVAFSSAERALEVLDHEGLVERIDRRYRLVDSARTREAVRFALAFSDPDQALAVLSRVNPAIEFCGVDADGALVVVRRFAESTDEARVRRALDGLREFTPDRRIELTDKAVLRERLLGDLGPRQRAEGMRILAGSVDRTFPDRTRHGDVEAPRLGRLHPSLPTPSRRRLRDLARRHRLRRILAFGSATRADFRADSDLDLVVEPAPGNRLGLGERVELIAETERLFGRDVDLLVSPVRQSSLAKRLVRDGVVVFDVTR